jgi:anthranilate synthase/aminodeoxychorismate synthase-like glutamine amidotransferase
MKIAFIDNFDSFTFNLVHYLQKTGADLRVFRNDELSENVVNQILQFDAVVVGPGPNSPSDAGNLMIVLKSLIENKIPILGVCLGHQALGELFGWQLKIAAAPVHGKSSLMRHSGKGIFIGLENPMQIGRYHSLIVTPPAEHIFPTVSSVKTTATSSTMNHAARGDQTLTINPVTTNIPDTTTITPSQEDIQLDDNLEIHGTDELGQVMAFSHKHLPIWAVQFHPESVLTPEGQLLLDNWVALLK